MFSGHFKIQTNTFVNLLFTYPSHPAGQMQGDGLKEETSVAGVLSHAVTHLGYTCRSNLQRGGRPQTGHVGHSSEGIFYLLIYCFVLLNVFYVWVK